MRTFGWLILLLVNFGVIAAFAPSMFYGDIVGFVVSALFSAICVLLVVARVQRLPSWGYTVMKILCSFVPVLWIAGALDHGMISGLEFLSLIFVVLLAWGTWRVFLFYVPRPNPAFKRDAEKRGAP